MTEHAKMPWGYGPFDLAIKHELHRLMREADGDADKALEVALRRCVDYDLITDGECDLLVRVLRYSTEAANGTRTGESAYVAVRRIHAQLLLQPNASPAAVHMAALSAESLIDIVDVYGTDEPSVVFAKRGKWADRGRTIGLLIGAKWGPLGAVVGATVGEEVGEWVDEKDAGEGGEDAGGDAPA